MQTQGEGLGWFGGASRSKMCVWGKGVWIVRSEKNSSPSSSAAVICIFGFLTELRAAL